MTGKPYGAYLYIPETLQFLEMLGGKGVLMNSFLGGTIFLCS